MFQVLQYNECFSFDPAYEPQILAGPLQGIIIVTVPVMQCEFYGHSRVFSVTLNGLF